ncbi:MAG: RnfABCDGE type electron transport complex subunit G [Alistipes sp.]|nr:RnfABCDGE type electron transport complex subunit G [Alistipes sp.]
MKSTLKNMVLVLFGITAIAALLVGLVNDITKNTIAQTEQRNKDLAKLEVLPEFEGEPQLEEKSRKIGDFNINVTIVKAQDQLVGYAVEAPSITSNGYGDRIYLMVGFVEQEGKAVINGVKVISQKETPGLGANMTNEGNNLERSVVGKDAAELKFAVKKKGGSFDALAGATISSSAYANAIETAYAGYLWAKGELPSAENATSGATKSTQESETNDESEAQKGDLSNE